MHVGDWISGAGVLLSLLLGVTALLLSNKANRVAKASADTAEEAFRYSTGLVWQLYAYEHVEKSDKYDLPKFEAGKVTFFLRAIGDTPATDVRIKFSYDPNGIRTSPQRWPLFDPREGGHARIESGLVMHELTKIQFSKGSTATVTWTDIADKSREFTIPLKDLPFYPEDPNGLLEEQ